MEQMTGPLRKIDRAKEHFDALDREIKCFIARKPYRCSVDVNPQTGNQILRPYQTEQIPPISGLLVGEFAHQLRSALDNIAFRLSIRPSSQVEFPIFLDDGDKFMKKLRLLRDSVRENVKAVQPYQRTNGKERHPLWVLHRINNVDKHRVITAGVTKLYITTGLEHPKFFFFDGLVHFNKGDVEFEVSGLPYPKGEFTPQITAQIVFDISAPPSSANDPARVILRDLFAIHDYVRNDIYPRFAKLLEPEYGV